MCASSRAAIPPACAASSWRAATKWSACRCSIIPTPASAEARAYLKQASAARRAESGEAEAPVEVEDDVEEGVEEATLTPERYAALGAREQFVLTMSQTGFGKRTFVL